MNKYKKLALILVAPITIFGIVIATSAQPSTPTIDASLVSESVPAVTENTQTPTTTITPETSTKSTSKPVSQYSPSTASAKPSPAPAQTQPQAPVVDRSAYIAACEAAKESQTQLYNANVNAENTRHLTNRSNIESDYRSRGLGFSGLMQDALNKEDQRHQAALAKLQADYQQRMGQQCL